MRESPSASQRYLHAMPEGLKDIKVTLTDADGETYTNTADWAGKSGYPFVKQFKNIPQGEYEIEVSGYDADKYDYSGRTTVNITRSYYNAEDLAFTSKPSPQSEDLDPKCTGTDLTQGEVSDAPTFDDPVTDEVESTPEGSKSLLQRST